MGGFEPSGVVKSYRSGSGAVTLWFPGGDLVAGCIVGHVRTPIARAAFAEVDRYAASVCHPGRGFIDFSDLGEFDWEARMVLVRWNLAHRHQASRLDLFTMSRPAQLALRALATILGDRLVVHEERGTFEAAYIGAVAQRAARRVGTCMMRAMKALALLPLVLSAACAASPPPSPTPPPTTATPTDPTSASTPAPTQAASSTPAATATAAATPASAPASSPASSSTPAAASTSSDDPLVGKPAPDFTARAQDGTTVHLSSLKGKTVVVYFYPKDETPGCTKEACSFRDAWTALGKTGAVLVGVSADTLDSHKAFAAHYKLPFLLVSDPDGSIAKQFSVPFEGHHKRQTIVIGADGNVRKVYRQVDVGVHAQQILDDVTHVTPVTQPTHAS